MSQQQSQTSEFVNQLTELFVEIEKVKLDLKEISMSDIESLQESINLTTEYINCCEACYQKANGKITDYPNVKDKHKQKHLDKLVVNIQQTQTFLDDAKSQIITLNNSKRDLTFTYTNHFNFTDEDYFNVEDLKLFFSNDITDDDKADMIKKVFSQYCLIRDNIIHIMLSNFTYYAFNGNSKQMLTTIIGTFLSTSVKRLSNEDIEALKAECGSKCINAQTSDLAISKYLQRVVTKLNSDGDDFDKYEKQIHFKNGYIDVKTGIFNKRNSSMRVRRCNVIERNYKPSTEEQRKFIMEKIMEIYPNEEDREVMMLIFGSAISGNGSLLNSMLFIVGMGSTGKSFVLEMIKGAFENYVLTPPSDAMATGNSKIDKIINNYLVRPHTLITWINEMSHKRIDTDLMKKWCEGFLQSCQLYKEGSSEVSCKSLLITTANILPNIPQDSGVARRIRSYEHTSLFTFDEKLIDNTKHIYKRVPDLLLKMKQNNMMDAVVDIFIGYARKFLAQPVLNIKLTPRFTESAENIAQVNDFVADFVDSKMEVTKDVNDKVGRDDMLIFFKNFKPDSHLTASMLIPKLKEKGIGYDSQIRINGIRGVYTNVKYKGTTTTSEFALIDNENYKQQNKQLQIQLLDKDDEIENLKQMIKDLQSKQIPIVVEKPIIVEKTIEVIEDDDNDDLPASTCIANAPNVKPLKVNYSKEHDIHYDNINQVDLGKFGTTTYRKQLKVTNAQKLQAVNSFDSDSEIDEKPKGPQKIIRNKKQVEIEEEEVKPIETPTKIIPFVGEKYSIDDDVDFMKPISRKSILKPKVYPKK